MNDNLEAFRQFAKNSNKPKDVNHHVNCVLYTRVSSSSQKDNTSLASQKKSCLKIIEELNLNLVATFGGVSESASGMEERKEYDKMFAFVKKKSNKIGFIVVFDLSRLSREGMKGVNDVQDLFKKYGVKITTVAQGKSDYTPAGMLHQNMQFLFNEYENHLRRDKCNQGSVNKMKQGYTVRQAPKGYDHTKANGEQIMVINKVGKAIGKAFKLKAQRKYSNEKILELLDNQDGVKLSRQRLSEIFKNPYYAGVIVDSRLDGEIVEGKHPKVVSMKTFLLVNNIQSTNHKNYKQNKKNDNLPLRGVLNCDKCGKPLTGYQVIKKGKFYYKCNVKGCKMNFSTDKAHNRLIEELQKFGLPEDHKGLFIAQLTKVFNHFNKGSKTQRKTIKTRIVELNKNIEKAELKMLHAEVEIEEIYLKQRNKFEIQKSDCEKELKELNIQLSNLEKFIDFSVELCLNLHKIWGLADWDTKAQMVSLIFPEGLTYNKEEEVYRTFETNKIFELINSFSKKKRKGAVRKNQLPHEKSRLVAPPGLEPGSIV
jgi:site-specific DNA recombinase